MSSVSAVCLPAVMLLLCRSCVYVVVWIWQINTNSSTSVSIEQ